MSCELKYNRCPCPVICVKQNLHRSRVGGLNIDSVTKYFSVLQEAILTVQERNGHPLQGDEILNMDETGHNLVVVVYGLEVRYK